jgi:hypothetical protein
LGTLLLSGCTLFGPYHSGGTLPKELPPPPPKEALIGYLNDNAGRIQSVNCPTMHIDATSGIESIGGIKGMLVCEKGRNFRLGAFAMGAQEVDVGSNDKEFWFWIKRNEPPYLMHCSYDDLNTGRVRMPFPFQPEWIMEALGITPCGPPEKYELKTNPNTLELVEKARSPQGQPITKVTVFQRTRAEGNQPQVTAHILQDAAGKEIVSAVITEVQQDPATGAILPRRVKLTCPSEKMTLKLFLEKVVVNDPKLPEREAALFTRPVLTGVTSYDLARGPDAPPASPVRRAGLFQR